MAFSAHTDPERIVEHNSTEDVLNAQADQLAEMIKSAKHFVAFTGAGVSTSAGIPDFRGPNGVWTRRAQGREAPKGVSSTRAIPTATHMALVAMATAGRLKLLISQNCDGLHRRSGFPPDRLAELHGNTNLEYCEKCSRQFLRDFRVRTSGSVHEHQTGRLCPVTECRGRLMDSVVNFGESLPEKQLNMGFEHCRAADLVLCLGSSLTVTPAADMPEEAAQKGAKLVICNLQTTPLDSLCCLRVFARTDDLMTRVCARLGLPLPAWRLRRRLQIDVGDDDASGHPVATFACVEEDNTPATIFNRLTIRVVSHDPATVEEAGGAELVGTVGTVGTVGPLAEFDRRTCAHATEFHARLPSLPCRVAMEMAFMGHYGEPACGLRLTVARPCKYAQQPILLEFDPTVGQWSCSGL